MVFPCSFKAPPSVNSTCLMNTANTPYAKRHGYDVTTSGFTYSKTTSYIPFHYIAIGF